MTSHDAPEEPGRWVPRLEAARLLGISARSLDRRLANHQYRSRPLLNGHREVWLDGATVAGQLETIAPSGPPLAHWEAISAILTRHDAPLLDTIARQQDTLARQAEEIAQLKAQLAAAAVPWWRGLWRRLTGRTP